MINASQAQCCLLPLYCAHSRDNVYPTQSFWFYLSPRGNIPAVGPFSSRFCNSQHALGSKVPVAPRPIDLVTYFLTIFLNYLQTHHSGEIVIPNYHFSVLSSWKSACQTKSVQMSLTVLFLASPPISLILELGEPVRTSL